MWNSSWTGRPCTKAKWCIRISTLSGMSPSPSRSAAWTRDFSSRYTFTLLWHTCISFHITPRYLQVDETVPFIDWLFRFTIEIWQWMTSWGPAVLSWINWNLKSRSIWNVCIKGQTRSVVSDAFVLSVVQELRDGAFIRRPQQPGGPYGCHSHRYLFICEEKQKQKTRKQLYEFKGLVAKLTNSTN